MCRGVYEVKEASEETTKDWAECVRVQVVIDVVLLAHPDEAIHGEGEADSRVERTTKVTSGGSAAKEREADSHDGAEALPVTGCVLALHHQDDADENEGADDFIEADSKVHGEVSFVTTNIGRSRSQVDWCNEGDLGVRLVDLTEAVETNCEHSSKTLRHHDHDHEHNVLCEIAHGDEDSKGHSRVEMTSSDVAEDDYGGHQAERDGEDQVLRHDSEDEHGRAHELKCANCPHSLVAFVCFHFNLICLLLLL